MKDWWRRHPVPVGISIGWVALWPFLLFEREGGLFAKGISLGSDWSFHLSYALRFTEPVGQWFTSLPIFLGVPFRYHFGSNFLSGMLLRLGLGEVAANLLPSMLLSVGVVWMAYLFYLDWTGRRERAGWALALLFLGGGFAFVVPLQEWWSAGKPWGAILRDPHSPSLVNDLGFRYGNFLEHLFIPQKALQLGLFVGFFLGRKFLLPVVRGSVAPSRRKQVFYGIGFGLLPILHSPTYLVLSLTVGVAILWRRRGALPFLPFVLAAAAATALVQFGLFGGAPAHGYLAWLPGWLAQSRTPQVNWLWFWLLNWGLFLPLAALSWNRKQRGFPPLIWGGWLWFAGANLIRFAPWDYDNTKIFTWSYLFLIPACLDGLDRLSSFWSRGNWLRPVALALLLTTGTLTLVKHLPGLGHEHRMFTVQEREAAVQLRQQLRPGEVVLAPPHVHNWTSSLAGAQILLGYPGWIWSIGIDFQERLREVQAMYQGDALGWQLLKHYGVRYVLIDQRAREEFKAQEEAFKDFPVLLDSPAGRLYEVTFQ